MNRKQLLNFANWVIARKRKLGSNPHNSDLVNIYMREKAQEYVKRVLGSLAEEWMDTNSEFIDFEKIDSIEEINTK